MRCGGCEIEQLDEALAALARGEAALRLRLGQLLEVMSRGAVFDLGFSSLEAYAVERCERSVRWVEAARCMARRVDELPALRRAIALGRVSWSMGEVLARAAEPGDEAGWLELAESRTVRQMRVLVAGAMASSQAVSAASALSHSAAPGERPSAGTDVEAVAHDDGDVRTEMCTLTCTVPQEDAWLFEATRSLLDHLGERGTDEQCEALLAEAQNTLLAALPEGALDLGQLQVPDGARERWLQQLEAWRAEAEALCEKNRGGWLHYRRHGSDSDWGHGSAAVAAALGMGSLEHLRPKELDANVRALRQAMARHELDVSRLMLTFHRQDGWRRLGYATETQYARERLGASRSTILARRSLALRLEKLPAVAAALAAGQLGVEAALQLVRVATPNTQAAWVARAIHRTVKHLREEVAAALVAVRWSGEVDCPPPLNTELVAFQALEQAVVSGSIFRGGLSISSSRVSSSRLREPGSEQRRAWYLMLGSLAAWLGGGGAREVQVSAGGANAVRCHAGRVTLRLRVSQSTGAWWRRLETLARRWLPPRVSWLRFLCLSLWQAWQHLLVSGVAYGHIYVRDRYRCVSPVCNRRDVTPHHLVFRSAGGGDEDDNVGAVCSWCHLRGVHGGRIRARGSAGHIHWEFGAASAPCLVVDGRERVAACPM